MRGKVLPKSLTLVEQDIRLESVRRLAIADFFAAPMGRKTITCRHSRLLLRESTSFSGAKADIYCLVGPNRGILSLRGFADEPPSCIASCVGAFLPRRDRTAP
jgi:hypothetical protein